MKRFANLLGKRGGHLEGEGQGREREGSLAFDSPEANAARGIRLFCESGSVNNPGEEVLHLPVIVDAAESSPQAAVASAHEIRKFLSKENYARPHVQYNAIMLIRILADNPGPTFTRNMDGKFVTTTKELLKNGRDASVQQILRETLDALEADKAYDANLTLLFSMWRKEKGHGATLSSGRPGGRPSQPAFPNGLPVHPQPVHTSTPKGLPAPQELASRIEEARNTAKILLQLVQSTPPNEVLDNELVSEFAERCQTASRSMQGYINCNNPPPDDDTMQTLIETNEQLSLAASRHQRAKLSARRALGGVSASASPNLADGNSAEYNVGRRMTTPPPAPPNSDPYTNSNPSFAPAPSQSPPNGSSYSFTASPPPGPPPSLTARLRDRSSPLSPVSPADDPFRDPVRVPAPPPKPTRPFSGASDLPNPQPSTFMTPFPPNHSSYRPFEPQHHGGPIQNDQGHGQRPGAYYAGMGPTPSYLGRQSSAINGITMHGAQSEPDIPEMDGDSRQGRAVDDVPSGAATQTADVSPIDLRAAYGRRI
ncbi:hypothetical protein LTR66_007428 [Elasticomyces elasticus]|nr:hypothetical protein LTR66_007428 [Elasticomyces elasticus]